MQPIPSTAPFRSFTTAALGVVLLAASACGGPGKQDPVCEDGEVRDCYSGADGTLGVGACTGGQQTCVEGAWSACDGETPPSEEVCDDIDNDCDGEIDEELKNACGGCAELEGAPDTPCGTCGTWECAGPESVSCLPPSPALGASCTADNGCEGVMECGADNVAQCVPLQRPNECGVCNGPPVDGLGEACEKDGCQGEYVCNEAGNAAVCSTTGLNECGVCGGPPVQGIDEPCTNDDGCEGVGACDATGTALACLAPTRNQCGECGGPDVTGIIGAPCNIDDCMGFMVCSETGDEVVCSSSGLNNCRQCNQPDVPGIDETCVADNGCEGVGACDVSAPGGMECVALSAPNACGVCGGAPIADVGLPCTHPDGCPGERVCNEDGSATVCNAPPLNACGGCGELPGAEDDPCETEDGCAGKYLCGHEGTLVCIADPPGTTRNSCGVCGPPVPDIGGTCATLADGCKGEWVCTEDGLDRFCEAREAANECGVCGGDPVAGVGRGCFTADGCPSVLGCNGTGDGVVCADVAPLGCSWTDHVVISEIATEGPVSPCPEPPTEGCTGELPSRRARNEFVELYNPTSEEVDLSGWMIWKRTNANPATEGGVHDFELVYQFPESTQSKMRPRSYLTWAGYFYPGPVVHKASLNKDYIPHGYQGSQLWLIRPDSVDPITPEEGPPQNISPSDPRVVDMVGWGDGYIPDGVDDYSWFEGTGPAPPLLHLQEGSPASLERKAFADSTAESLGTDGPDRLLGNGWDSDDSAADWVVRPVRQPQTRASPVEPELPSHPSP